MKTTVLSLLLAATVAISGCMTAPYSQALAAGDQLQTRSYQTRAFETTDREKTLRAIIATMQDLGFVIDKADETLGTVTATKLNVYQMRMTVTVRPRGEKQLLVRANAEFQDKAVSDPLPYQDFFTSLEKSMFLAAQQVD